MKKRTFSQEIFEVLRIAKNSESKENFLYLASKHFCNLFKVNDIAYLFVIEDTSLISIYDKKNDTFHYQIYHTNRLSADKESFFLKEYNQNFEKGSAKTYSFRIDRSIYGFCITEKFSDKYKNNLERFLRIINISLFFIHSQMKLNERVKELTCLYGIARISEKKDYELSSTFKEIVELLPAAWQHPELAAARINYEDMNITSSNFKPSNLRQKANIVINDENYGFVEVNYPEDAFSKDFSPFLAEEEKLINIIARELSIIVEKKISKEKRENLERQLRHADRLATLGQLSAGVAHEINEPLSNILGFAQLIKKNPNIDQQAKNDTENIISASLHAREIVKKLMLFARQMPPQKSKVNINDIVEKGMFFLESRCTKNGIEIHKRLASNIPDFTADPSQMHQVLVNLVVNAVQAMGKGGKLDIITKFDKDNIVLIVKDNGIGMSEETRKQIFIPFFTTKKINEGTGLGLPVAHGIIKSHNGEILVKTKEKVGTEMKVLLPIKAGKNEFK